MASGAEDRHVSAAVVCLLVFSHETLDLFLWKLLSIIAHEDTNLF